jgi:hypothetical protein
VVLPAAVDSPAPPYDRHPACWTARSKGVEILARPIRLAHAGQNQGMNLAVEFLRTEEAKLKKLRKVL